MKLPILILTILLSPIFLNAQNLPACDSVFIDCCSFDSPEENTISIIVSNYSSDIFSYPGFILFTENMDTIAIETVNYYGIGWSQIHVLNIIQPLTLPFEGILELHTGFYDTQVCSFPVTIPDSTLTQIRETSAKEIKIYPNPADDFISLENKQAQNINQLLITDLNGRIVIELNKLKTTEVNVEYLKPGLYFVHILKEEGETFQSKFIKQ